MVLLRVAKLRIRIETNERKHAVRFGFNALREFSRMTGTTLAQLEDLGVDMTLDQAVTLMYCGFKDGARKEKVISDTKCLTLQIGLMTMKN